MALVCTLVVGRFGRTAALNVAAYCGPVSSISAGRHGNEQIADARADHCGSDADRRRRATSAPERAETTVTSGQRQTTRTSPDLGMRRLTPCGKRPSNLDSREGD